MVEACERRIREFPLGNERAGEVAKVLKRQGWYAWASDYASTSFSDRAQCGQKRGAGDLLVDSSQARDPLVELNGPITPRDRSLTSSGGLSQPRRRHTPRCLYHLSGGKSRIR